MNEIEKKLFDRGIIAPNVPVMPTLIPVYTGTNFCTLQRPVIYYTVGGYTHGMRPEFCVTDTAAFEAVLKYIVPFDRDYQTDMKKKAEVVRLEWEHTNLYLFEDKVYARTLEAQKAQIANWVTARDAAQQEFNQYTEEYAKELEIENQRRLDQAQMLDRFNYLKQVRELANNDEEKVKGFFALAGKDYNAFLENERVYNNSLTDPEQGIS